MSRYLGLAAILVLALIAPFFVYSVTLMTILVFVIFASSFNLLPGLRRTAQLRPGNAFGTAAYITGHILKTTGVSLEIAIIGGMLVGAAMGFLVGLVAVRRSGIQFAMITFAIAQFVYFLLLQSEFTGGETACSAFRARRSSASSTCRTIPPLYYFCPCGDCPVDRLLLPRRSFALRRGAQGNPRQRARVRSLGFKPDRYKLVAMTLSAGMAGLAGGLKATVFQFATLTDVSWHVSGEVIFMTLLGGLGTLTGPMVGAGIVIGLNDHLAQFGEWALISQGVILLAVILFFRRGVVGELGAFVRRYKAGGRK